MMPGGAHSAFYDRKIIVLKNNNNLAHSAIGYSPLPNAYRAIAA